LEEKKAEGVENEAVEQLAFADRILLNKIDLVTEDELTRLESRIHQINSGAPIKRTQKSLVDLSFILNIGAFDLSRVLASDPAFLEEQQHQVYHMLQRNLIEKNSMTKL
jgi:G3E family GTPase